QRVVLPEADPERHPESGEREDDPRAELVEVLDQAESILVPDWPDPACHGTRRRALGRVGGSGGSGARFLVDGRGHGLAGRDRGRLLEVALLQLLLVVLAGDRVLELARPTPQRPTQVGQPLGPEDQEHDYEDDDDLNGADVRHEASLSGADECHGSGGTGWSGPALGVEIQVEAARRRLRLALVLVRRI